MPVKTVPDGYNTVMPFLVVNDVNAVMDFLKKTVNAQVKMNMPGPDGKPMHAEMTIGESVIMMGQACAEHKPFPAMLYIYLDDVDAAYKRALSCGATSMKEPADQFYGDRTCMVRDSFGNEWCFATHKEDLSEKELKERAAVLAK
jgi:PhnB protein